MRNGAVHADVIIIDAGPTGLTLACDLARRGVSFRIVDKAAEPFAGSRVKDSGISDKDNVIFLVRPDGYVGLIASQNWMDSVNEYQKAVACVQHDSMKLGLGTR